MSEPIRIFIADDHTLFRDGLHALFRSIEDIEVVGEAADGEQVVAGAAETQPDIVYGRVILRRTDTVKPRPYITQASDGTGSCTYDVRSEGCHHQ